MLTSRNTTAQFSDLSSLHRYQIHLMGFLVYILRKNPNDVADNNEVSGSYSSLVIGHQRAHVLQ